MLDIEQKTFFFLLQKKNSKINISSWSLHVGLARSPQQDEHQGDFHLSEGTVQYFIIQ
jgi:hypothetical protein